MKGLPETTSGFGLMKGLPETTSGFGLMKGLPGTTPVGAVLTANISGVCQNLRGQDRSHKPRPYKIDRSCNMSCPHRVGAALAAKFVAQMASVGGQADLIEVSVR